ALLRHSKRKRADTESSPRMEPLDLPGSQNGYRRDAKKCRTDERMIINGFKAEQSDTAASSKLARLRQAIDSQFSLEILLKHNELRLIEQELAKCQIAM